MRERPAERRTALRAVVEDVQRDVRAEPRVAAGWGPAVVMLAQALPDLAGEREFQRVAAELGVDLNLDALLAPPALTAARSFAARLGQPAPRTAADVEDLLARAAEGLDVFARTLAAQGTYDSVVASKVKRQRVEEFYARLPADLQDQTRRWLAERGFRGLKVPRAPAATVTPDAVALARGRLTIACAALVTRYPFYGHLLARGRLEMDTSVATSGVAVRDGALVFSFHPAPVAECALEVLVGALAHLCGHVVMGHPAARVAEYPDAIARRIAEDVTVNEFVREPLPPGALTLAQYPALPLGESTYRRYTRLTRGRARRPRPTPKPEGASAPPASELSPALDDHSPWSHPAVDRLVVEATLRIVVRAAAAALDTEQHAALPRAVRDALAKGYSVEPGGYVQKRIGTALGGKYQLTRLLGVGGMGAVYEAQNPWTQRRVAVKLMRAEVAEEADLAARFLREARAAARLEHPNVVQVFDAGRDDDGSIFIVQKLLAGNDLRHLLTARRTLSPREALEIVVPVCGALVAAHRAGIAPSRRSRRSRAVQAPRTGSDRARARADGCRARTGRR